MNKSAAMVTITLAALFGAVGCGSDSNVGVAYSDAPAAPTKNTDPKKGWVQIFEEKNDANIILIRCHGDRLVYMRNWSQSGIDVLPNDPLCTS